MTTLRKDCHKSPHNRHHRRHHHCGNPAAWKIVYFLEWGLSFLFKLGLGTVNGGIFHNWKWTIVSSVLTLHWKYRWNTDETTKNIHEVIIAALPHQSSCKSKPWNEISSELHQATILHTYIALCKSSGYALSQLESLFSLFANWRKEN